MNIQPSVLIWTVICFAVLMLVLDRLLFRPLLSFMDARKAKIDAAQRLRIEAQEKQALALQAAEAERREAEKQAHAAAQMALEQARRDAAQNANAMKLAYEAQLEQEKADMLAKRQMLRKELDGGIDGLVAALMEKLAL